MKIKILFFLIILCSNILIGQNLIFRGSLVKEIEIQYNRGGYYDGATHGRKDSLVLKPTLSNWQIVGIGSQKIKYDLSTQEKTIKDQKLRLENKMINKNIVESLLFELNQKPSSPNHTHWRYDSISFSFSDRQIKRMFEDQKKGESFYCKYNEQCF
jgi:hypothetical protein